MKAKRLLTIFLLFSLKTFSYADYVKNEPITLKQPNGKEINVFITGDEFYNWLHDKDEYTIIRNPVTGYYCYAVLKDEKLVASPYVVGQTDPVKTELPSRINISDEEIMKKRQEFFQEESKTVPKSGNTSWNSGTLNNIVIYIRFADQPEFDANQEVYTAMFNATSGNSMKNYFYEISYGNLTIQSHFFPTNNGSTILSYQDTLPLNYYCPKSVSNPLGYTNSEKTTREETLVASAINHVISQIPSSLNLDFDNNGMVDNICFIIRGADAGFSDLLWPHIGYLFYRTILINDKRVYKYNLHSESRLSIHKAAVLCHEMAHTLGAPDLYHNNYNSEPVGKWDLMASHTDTPQNINAYIKYKYLDWISYIPSITDRGTYTLNPLSSPSQNCYKIRLGNTSEYLVLEYRKKEGPFDNQIYGSGLLIYRINDAKHGNNHNICYGGTNDEVYIFRPGGTVSSDGTVSQANFSNNVNRTSFNKMTDPYCFISDGSRRKPHISNIRENPNGTLSFNFCYLGDAEDVVFSNTNTLPSNTDVKGNIRTEGNVTVKSTDNVTFKSAEGITLDVGFSVEQGGTFNAIVEDCE